MCNEFFDREGGMADADERVTPEERAADEWAALEQLQADPDELLVSDYLSGELDADAERAVEQRLETDAVFLEKNLSVLVTWAVIQRRTVEYVLESPDDAPPPLAMLSDAGNPHWKEAIRATVPSRVARLQTIDGIMERWGLELLG
jgi:anti-sigma factor RsiW